MEHGLYSHLFILGLKNLSQTVKASGFEVNCFIAYVDVGSYFHPKRKIMLLNACLKFD